MQGIDSSILALDVGDKRIGVAVARLDVRLPHPLVTLDNDDAIWEHIRQLITDSKAASVVVGLPRGLDGQDTAQTRKSEAFAETLRQQIDVPVHQVDEAATSVKAEAELRARGKPYEKSAIDALAATFILEDYLAGLGANHV